MSDNVPEGSSPQKPGIPEPASDAKKHANKLVVLSSVAKIPQEEGESLLGEPAATDPKASEPPRKPEEGGLIRPVGWTIRPGGTTTIIKLPPKTGVLPRLTSLSTTGKPDPVPLKTAPAPIAGNEPVSEDDETKRLPPVKLPNAGSDASASPPPLPAQPVASSAEKASSNSSLGKTVLLSKSSKLPDPGKVTPASLQPTTRLQPAPIPPAPVERHPIMPVVPLEEPEVETSGKRRRPFFLFPPGKKKAEARAAEALKASKTEELKPISPKPPELDRPPKLVSATGPLPASSVTAEIAAAAASSAVTSRIEPEFNKMKLPPRVNKGAQPALSAEKPDALITPPKVFPATPATTPITPASSLFVGSSQPVKSMSDEMAATTDPEGKTPSQLSRAARVRKRRIAGIIGFYVIMVVLVPILYFTSLTFSKETRVEGQVIPPSGMYLSKEVWIVTDFRDLASGIANDLAGDRSSVMADMQEKLAHVQRAQADVASRETKIRLLKDQIKTANDSQINIVKEARAASQKIWDGPGAQLEADYQSRLTSLDAAIRERAKANNLKYEPDPNFYSPEVWANAYHLSLYQVPAGVDAVKERGWLDEQMKGWRQFTKDFDTKQTALREQAAQLKMAPAAKLSDLKAQADDLQQRIDGTITEEEPLKAELEQAQTDLAAVQAREAGLDAKPYQKLYALPEQMISKRLDLQPNGRFSWRALEKDSKYAEGEKSHVYWLFARATRPDGRQYWSLHRFTVDKDTTVLLMIEPESFISTKAILRPDLPPNEQAQ